MNDCNVNNGGCAQVCTNTQNSLECSCYVGYLLDSDGISCIGMLICYSISESIMEHCTFKLSPDGMAS